MASPRDISARHLGRRRGGIIPQPNARLPDTPPVDVHARGRSPGLRVAASVRLPKAFAPQWLCRTNARRLQLRGQLRIVAAVMATPDSRLSLRSSRIEGTSNTIYSSPCKIHVNGWGGFRTMKCKLSPAAVDNGDAGRYPHQAMRGARTGLFPRPVRKALRSPHWQDDPAWKGPAVLFIHGLAQFAGRNQSVAKYAIRFATLWMSRKLPRRSNERDIVFPSLVPHCPVAMRIIGKPVKVRRCPRNGSRAKRRRMPLGLSTREGVGSPKGRLWSPETSPR